MSGAPNNQLVTPLARSHHHLGSRWGHYGSPDGSRLKAPLKFNTATIPWTVQARRCVVLAGGVLGRAGKTGLIPRGRFQPNAWDNEDLLVEETSGQPDVCQ